MANRIIWVSFSGDPHTIRHQQRPFWRPNWGYLWWGEWLNKCGMNLFGSDLNKYVGTFWKRKCQRLVCTKNIIYGHIFCVIKTLFSKCHVLQMQLDGVDLWRNGRNPQRHLGQGKAVGEYIMLLSTIYTHYIQTHNLYTFLSDIRSVCCWSFIWQSIQVNIIYFIPIFFYDNYFQFMKLKTIFNIPKKNYEVAQQNEWWKQNINNIYLLVVIKPKNGHSYDLSYRESVNFTSGLVVRCSGYEDSFPPLRNTWHRCGDQPCVNINSSAMMTCPPITDFSDRKFLVEGGELKCTLCTLSWRHTIDLIWL